jgi:hypothetical protein
MNTKDREKNTSNVVKDMHKFVELLKKHEVESTDYLLQQKYFPKYK